MKNTETKNTANDVKKVNVKLNEFIAWTITDSNNIIINTDDNIIFKTKKEATEYCVKEFSGCYNSKAEMMRNINITQYIFSGNTPVRSLDSEIEKIGKKQETINKIGEIIDAAEKYKNAYFFNPPASASGRRWLEDKYNLEEVEWKEGNDTYAASFSLECSCRNIYTYPYYTKNGKKTNLTAIRNSYNRLVNNK